MYYKKILILLLTFLMILLPLVGCDSSEDNPSEEIEPADPVDIDLFFPDGAPPLNQTAELVCTVDSWLYVSLNDLSINITLPAGFELVSGNLSWVGDISMGEKVEVIRAVIKSVEVGNYVIEWHISMNPETQGSYSFVPGWHPVVYVTVSEDSADWAYWRLWKVGESSGLQVEVEAVD